MMHLCCTSGCPIFSFLMRISKRSEEEKEKTEGFLRAQCGSASLPVKGASTGHQRVANQWNK